MDIRQDIKSAQKKLGIEKLRKHQVKPINSILDRQDTMVIAPTSAGKSAIYQVPALIFSGMTLVIEPTLSLMYDQTYRLKSHGINAAYIDSTMSTDDYSHILKCIAKSKVKILFVTPERIQNRKFLDAIEDVEISMVVVDECHCVTSWGYGFRPDYLRIGKFIDTLPHRPVVAALTATATSDMREEICDLLSIDQPEVFINSLHRPNLHFIKRSFVSDEAKLKELLFLSGERHIMVATSAFGLGVDQSDVDLVIHFNLPLSLIDYCQQAGRAGRAGQKAKCILLYCENDYPVNRTILKEIDDKSVRKNALRALDRMKEYAESTGCLTSQVLSALGEKLDKPCGSCTNCQKRRKK